MNLIALAFIITFLSCEKKAEKETTPVPPPPSSVVPRAEQVTYQQMEMIGFIHYTVNAFTDKE